MTCPQGTAEDQRHGTALARLRPLFGQCCCRGGRQAGEPEQGTTRDQTSHRRSSLLGGLWLSPHAWAMALSTSFRLQVCLTRRPSQGCSNVFTQRRWGVEGKHLYRPARAGEAGLVLEGASSQAQAGPSVPTQGWIPEGTRHHRYLPLRLCGCNGVSREVLPEEQRFFCLLPREAVTVILKVIFPPGGKGTARQHPAGKTSRQGKGGAVAVPKALPRLTGRAATLGGLASVSSSVPKPNS